MASAAVGPLVSERQFLALPESTERIELLDGEVIVSPSATYWHQEVLGRLVRALHEWADRQKRAVTVAQSPLDVRFGRNRILQPDAFVLFAEVPWEHKGPVDQIPELCIEILSENRVYDRVTKRLVYGAAGVRELWTVDPAGLVERWTGPGLADRRQPRTQLTSPLLPGFRLELRKLFARRRAR